MGACPILYLSFFLRQIFSTSLYQHLFVVKESVVWKIVVLLWITFSYLWIVSCKLFCTVYQYCTYFNFSEVHTMKMRTVWMSKGLILLWSFHLMFCTASKYDPNKVCVVRMIPFNFCCWWLFLYKSIDFCFSKIYFFCSAVVVIVWRNNENIGWNMIHQTKIH